MSTTSDDHSSEPRHILEESDFLLKSLNVDDEETEQPNNLVSRHVARRIYLSHTLSTWNSRVFEFGAVLYLAKIYSSTLLPMSIYAFTRGFAAVIFAPVVGQIIDNCNRLNVVRLSIVVQRLAVAISCVIFYLLILPLDVGNNGKTNMLVLLSFLACLEKLSSIMNDISIEKDWIVVICRKNHNDLRAMNAQMRRIDLLCKLLGPLFISLVDSGSTEIAIILNFGMNVASIVFEYFAIARIYYNTLELQQPKYNINARVDEEQSLRLMKGGLTLISAHINKLIKKSAADFKMYFTHRAFLPSLAGALLYLTVLSFGGQMVTYLLSIGYSSTQVGIARTFGVVFEVLATWVAPWIMSHIGPVRAGLWHSSWQIIMLLIGTIIFFIFNETNPSISAGGLVLGTIFSRMGLRGFDLCVQIIVQEDVEADIRGAFSSVEVVWQNVFELISYASTIIFSKPSQFRWPTLISVIAVSTASCSYALFVRFRRGHLVHLDLVTKLLRSSKGKQKERERVVERITSSSDI